ncbi:MAG: YncE family protein [Bacteroidota bacterium]
MYLESTSKYTPYCAFYDEKAVTSFHRLFLLVIFLFFAATQLKSQTYFIDTIFYPPFKGDWRYPTVNPSSNKLYITHGNQVSILDKNTGDSIGIIPNTPGVEGVALAPKFGKGFTTNSQTNSVTVFDLRSDRFIKNIQVGNHPDWILYDVFSSKIVVGNYKGGSLSVIDPKLDKVETTIPLGGNRVTGMVSDGNGNLYVHLEDKREIVWIKMTTYDIEMYWSLGTGKSPAGMAIDTKYNRLFSVCNKLLVIYDINTAKIVDSMQIGENPDGIVFDPVNKLIFVANGNGSLSIISQLGPDDYTLVENIPTKKGSNSLAFDEGTSALFVPGADQLPAPKTSVKQTSPALTRWIPSTFQVMVLDKL